ncbi:MAG: shikimate dehydrogenase [Chitinophagaceae bacterium]|nr:MAG: shikimate dehydrogenase [Chitinophagaceae bacterium]
MKRYGLIGRTLKHSFSKTYFAKKFADEGITDCVYDNFELAGIEEFPQLFTKFPDLEGLNITIPYKEEVMQYLTEKDRIVQAIGACNCIKIEGANRIGYNTDAIGFLNSLKPLLKSYHKKALILGTGGASKAVRYSLEELGIEFKFVSRAKGEGQLAYNEVTEEVLAEHHLIINTTPLGMYPNVDAAPALTYEILTPKHFLFDLTYNPAKTKFLAEGEKQGAQISNGHQMLIEQAEAAWEIWKNS